jgi:hypothetical protein
MYEEVINKYKDLLDKLLNSQTYTLEELNNDFKKNKLNSKHNVPGVYIIFEENNNIVYAGRTTSKCIIDRVGNQHIYGGASSDLRDLVGRPPVSEILKYKCKYLEIRNNIERSRFEHFLISVLNPKLNK